MPVKNLQISIFASKTFTCPKQNSHSNTRVTFKDGISHQNTAVPPHTYPGRWPSSQPHRALPSSPWVGTWPGRATSREAYGLGWAPASRRARPACLQPSVPHPPPHRLSAVLRWAALTHNGNSGMPWKHRPGKWRTKQKQNKKKTWSWSTLQNRKPFLVNSPKQLLQNVGKRKLLLSEKMWK